MSISVTVVGQKELDAKFKKLERTVQDKIMREATTSAAKIVWRDARSRIQSRSGRLRRSVKIGKPRKTKKGMEVDIFTELFYALMVEKGHVWETKKKRGHTAGRPFLTPALDSRRDEVLAAISFKVKQAVMKVAG